MKNFLQKLEKSYLGLYKWLLLILALVIVYYLYSCEIFLIKDLAPYLQTIFIGFIAFGIPFMWNAYQRILEIKSQSIGEKIEHILSKEFYQKANKYFEAFLLFPTALLVFVGLIVSPFLPLLVAIVLIIFSVIFFILQPRIFSWIEGISATDLKNYLIRKDPTDPDLLKVFRELWQKDDKAVEKDLAIIPGHLMNIFADKMEKLIDHE